MACPAKNTRWLCLTLVLAGSALGCAELWAATIGISNTRSLGFGSFVAGAGGSVTISPAGVRSASGAVTLVPSDAGTSAQFTVTGDESVSYSIALPLDGESVLSDGASHSMALRAFASDPSGIGLLVGGSQTLSVGATLDVGANQAHGAYSGTFTVTVNYN